jgi:hypothetical protein
MEYRFHDTAHVEKRARERGFSVEQAILAVKKPGSILKTPARKGNHGGFIWLFLRLFESRILVVVAEVKNDECWVITGYWEEQR